MKKSMLIIPGALIGTGMIAYFMCCKKGKKECKMVRELKDSMDNMMGE